MSNRLSSDIIPKMFRHIYRTTSSATLPGTHTQPHAACRSRHNVCVSGSSRASRGKTINMIHLCVLLFGCRTHDWTEMVWGGQIWMMRCDKTNTKPELADAHTQRNNLYFYERSDDVVKLNRLSSSRQLFFFSCVCAACCQTCASHKDTHTHTLWR